jgi:hypothetical protein
MLLAKRKGAGRVSLDPHSLANYPAPRRVDNMAAARSSPVRTRLRVYTSERPALGIAVGYKSALYSHVCDMTRGGDSSAYRYVSRHPQRPGPPPQQFAVLVSMTTGVIAAYSSHTL